MKTLFLRFVREDWWVVLLLPVLVALKVWSVFSTVDEAGLNAFPESYRVRLAALHERHPNWRFEPLAVTDLTWREVLDKECSPGWNLVNSNRWAAGEWKKLGVANYTPYIADRAKAYDSGAWYQASREAVAYFMDPRNFLNESEIFMFETLAFDRASQPRRAVERALSGSFMHEATYDGSGRKYSELLSEIGEQLNVSAVFLASRLKSEQGGGTVQAKGTIGDSLVALYSNAADRVRGNRVWGGAYSRNGTNTAAVIAAGAAAYNGHYNFFNIGAFGTGVFEIRLNAYRETVSAETCRRYLGPWTSQEKAIRGGALKIKERYVDGGRQTRYLQKFSVNPQAGSSRWRQYMQNIAAPLMESRSTSAAYAESGAMDAPYRFIIPVYAEMPESPCPDPARGNSVFSATKR